MQSMKETASNMAASVKSGMGKTKATVQLQVENMTDHDPVEKEMERERETRWWRAEEEAQITRRRSIGLDSLLGRVTESVVSSVGPQSATPVMAWLADEGGLVKAPATPIIKVENELGFEFGASVYVIPDNVLEFE